MTQFLICHLEFTAFYRLNLSRINELKKEKEENSKRASRFFVISIILLLIAVSVVPPVSVLVVLPLLSSMLVFFGIVAAIGLVPILAAVFPLKAAVEMAKNGQALDARIQEIYKGDIKEQIKKNVFRAGAFESLIKESVESNKTSVANQRQVREQRLSLANSVPVGSTGEAFFDSRKSVQEDRPNAASQGNLSSHSSIRLGFSATIE